MHAMATRKRLREEQELREEEAEAIQQAINTQAESQPEPNLPNGQGEMTLGDALEDPSLGKGRVLYSDEPEEDQRITQTIKENYKQDLLTRMVLARPEDHRKFFNIIDGLIWTKNYRDQNVVCVPRENNLITRLLSRAHDIVGHYGEQKTCEYIRRWYWWPQMSKSTHNFCKTCEACQRAKGPSQ
jgi:hypothetical protein